MQGAEFKLQSILAIQILLLEYQLINFLSH